jgi:hypothetical protein
MVPPPESDEFDTPTTSLRGRAAGTIERVCMIIARWSILPFLCVGCLFFVYLIGGSIAVVRGGGPPSYEFLSFPEDVYFAWLSFLFGAVVCI